MRFFLFLDRVEPYLQLKKKQALLLRDILVCKEKVSSQKNFSVLLAKIDSFRELNYSKKHKKVIP